MPYGGKKRNEMTNKETKANQFNVAQAFKQGKQIQLSPKGKEQWQNLSPDIKMMIWNWKDYDYRIKEK